jgi:hypothetical protein
VSKGDSDLRLLVVRPARGANEDTVRAYLYAHAHVLTVVSQGYGPLLVVLVMGNPRIEGSADYLTEYQADRLRSGGHRVSVFETYGEAAEWAQAKAVEE